MAWLLTPPPPTPVPAPAPPLPQAALQEGLRSARELHRKAEEIVAESVEALLEVDMDEAAALAYLKESTPGILRCDHNEAAVPACGGAGVHVGLCLLGWAGLKALLASF